MTTTTDPLTGKATMFLLLIAVLATGLVLAGSGLPLATALFASALVMVALLQFRLRSQVALLLLAALSLLGMAAQYLPGAVTRLPALAPLAALLPYLQGAAAAGAIAYALWFAWPGRAGAARDGKHG